MTIGDRILQYLREHPEGATDSELVTALGLCRHQDANYNCRLLSKQGLIQRVKRNGQTIRNYWLGPGPAARETVSKPGEQERAEAAPRPTEPSGPHDSWYWEGNVQSAVVGYLAGHGYDILRVCHTASRERGKDIEARSGETKLWVTVKGYPRDTERTQATVQAGHWFSGALFDIICWRGEDENAELALALPDFPRYRNLAERVAWLKSAAGFYFIWVREDGEVEIER